MVDLVEKEVENGNMGGVEILFLTDNSVGYAKYYQENSSNKEIFELMLRLVYL